MPTAGWILLGVIASLFNTVQVRNGVCHGPATESKSTGDYLNGKRRGRWTLVTSTGTRQHCYYVKGKKQGAWLAVIKHRGARFKRTTPAAVLAARGPRRHSGSCAEPTCWIHGRQHALCHSHGSGTEPATHLEMGTSELEPTVIKPFLSEVTTVSPSMI